MNTHSFILSPGKWQGEGTIKLNMIDEELIFHAQWTVFPKDDLGQIQCIQEIEIDGMPDKMRNELLFYEIQPHLFKVQMNNDNIEKILGSGFIEEGRLAWEFRDSEIQFEGYEIYQLQEDRSYEMRAEYMTSDQFRTKILGRIWSEGKGATDQIKLSDQEDEEE